MGGFSLGNSKSTNAAKSLGDDVTVNLRTIAMYMWRQEFTFPISTGTACNKVTFGESLPLLGVSQLRTYRGFSDSGCRGGRKRSRLLCQSTKITVCQKGNVLLTQMAAKNCDAIFWYMWKLQDTTAVSRLGHFLLYSGRLLKMKQELYISGSPTTRTLLLYSG